MADHGSNPDLWVATAGPCQPLIAVFYSQKFLSQNFAFLGICLKHLLLANCVIVDQAVVQLNCSAHLRWASYNFLVQSYCFVIIVQQLLVSKMSILMKLVDLWLEYTNETFFSENNTIIQIHLCTVVKYASVKEDFCRNFGPLGNNYFFKCEEKLRHFQLF